MVLEQERHKALEQELHKALVLHMVLEPLRLAAPLRLALGQELHMVRVLEQVHSRQVLVLARNKLELACSIAS